MEILKERAVVAFNPNGPFAKWAEKTGKIFTAYGANRDGVPVAMNGAIADAIIATIGLGVQRYRGKMILPNGAKSCVAVASFLRKKRHSYLPSRMIIA